MLDVPAVPSERIRKFCVPSAATVMLFPYTPAEVPTIQAPVIVTVTDSGAWRLADV